MAEAAYVPPEVVSGSAPVVVRLTGDVDIVSADRAGAEMARVSNRGGRDGVVLDLSEVTFMDCCGLSVLVRARNSLGDRLRLHNPSPAVTKLLDLTDLRDTFVITDEHR
jgi:anti-sigma B factor antagonist